MPKSKSVNEVVYGEFLEYVLKALRMKKRGY